MDYRTLTHIGVELNTTLENRVPHDILRYFKRSATPKETNY